MLVVSRPTPFHAVPNALNRTFDWNELFGESQFVSNCGESSNQFQTTKPLLRRLTAIRVATTSQVGRLATKSANEIILRATVLASGAPKRCSSTSP